MRRNFKKENILAQIAEIALGKPNDVVKLVFLDLENIEDTIATINSLDLSMLSEIKRSGGSVEIKLINRIEALKLLMGEIEAESGGNKNAEMFFNAINQVVNEGAAER